MSHFSVLVITHGQPSEEDLAHILQPWHEYECTGVDDEYVVDVDVTDEVLEQFNKPQRVVRLANGEIYSRWDDRFYTGPKTNTFDRTGTFELPAGASEADMPAEEARKHGVGYATTAACAKDYFGAFERDGRFYDRTNPNKKWDWWQVGGRFTGCLSAYDPDADPANQETCSICGGSGRRDDNLGRSARKADPKYSCNGCDGKGWRVKWPTAWARHSGDQMQVGAVDWVGIRARAEAEAGAKWDEVRAAAGAAWVPFEAFRAAHGNDGWDAARDGYWAQPALNKDVRKLTYSPDDFLIPREAYCRAAGLRAGTTFALVYEGKWYQRGDMGWWGMVANEEDPVAWAEKYHELIASLPAGAWLTVVDCHI